MLFENNRL